MNARLVNTFANDKLRMSLDEDACVGVLDARGACGKSHEYCEA